MAKMNCSQIQELLADYSVGAVGWRRRRHIRNHLGRCPGCDRELRVLMASADLIRKLPAATPPDNLWTGITSEIEASEPAFAPRRRPLIRSVVIAVAAIVSVAVLVSVTPRVPQVPVSSAGLYVRAHLVATGQFPMLSAALAEPMLRTSERRNGGSEKE